MSSQHDRTPNTITHVPVETRAVHHLHPGWRAEHDLVYRLGWLAGVLTRATLVEPPAEPRSASDGPTDWPVDY